MAERRVTVRGSRTELLDTLLKLGYLSPATLRNLRMQGTRKGVPDLESAVLSGVLHPDAKGWILAEALGIPFLDADPDAVPLSLAEILPEGFSRENMAVPLSREGDRLTLAVADPFLHGAFARVEEMTGLAVRLVVCPARTIAAVIARLHPEPRPLPPEEIAGGGIAREEAEEWIARGRGRRLAEKVVLHAVRTGIATVRLYPSGRRMVIDGDAEGRKTFLLSVPLRFRDALVGSFMELAGVSPGPGVVEETFQLETETGVRAFRISVLRGLSGMEAVVKILPDLRSVISLDSIGFHPDQMEITRRMLDLRSGVYLVSSPGTGGVATTIFAMLRDFYGEDDRVVTVEESHSFRNDGYIQLERRDAEIRFRGKWSRLAEALEPDALMIERVAGRGELLDLVHIARRGVAVLCGMGGGNISQTLHTLFSLDVDPFVLTRIVRLVMHQRLVDLLCTECRREVPAVPSLKLVGERYRGGLEPILREVSFFVHGGCSRCRGTGYSGKIALFDLLPMTPGVQALILADAPPEERIERIVDEHLQSAFPSVEDLLRRGMVTFDDVLPFFR